MTHEAPFAVLTREHGYTNGDAYAHERCGAHRPRRADRMAAPGDPSPPHDRVCEASMRHHELPSRRGRTPGG